MDSHQNFFLKFWDLMKANFLTLFDGFYKNRKLNSCVQENFICLIQKKENAVEVKDFRPISLTTLTYMVIAKLLAEKSCPPSLLQLKAPLLKEDK